MRRSPASLFAVVVATAAVTSWLTHLALPGRAAPDPSPAAPALGAAAPTSSDGTDALREELRDLGRRLEVAVERVAALEARDAVPARTPAGDWATKEELQALREQIRRGSASTAPLPAPEFKTQVAKALSAIRKDEVLQAHEKNASRLEDRVAKLTQWLGLTGYQASELHTILSRRDERDRALIQMWQQGVDEQVLGDTKRRNHEDFQTEVERLLTPEQWTRFQEGESKGAARNAAKKE